MKSLTARVVRHWNRLPGEGVDSPAVEVLKARFWINLEQPGLVQSVPALAAHTFDSVGSLQPKPHPARAPTALPFHMGSSAPYSHHLLYPGTPLCPYSCSCSGCQSAYVHIPFWKAPPNPYRKGIMRNKRKRGLR